MAYETSNSPGSVAAERMPAALDQTGFWTIENASRTRISVKEGEFVVTIYPTTDVANRYEDYLTVERRLGTLRDMRANAQSGVRYRVKCARDDN